uniref:Uncharacterized protein n=1 Tax=Acrobeloides nanus TaxID=290746 RepID=A0A914D1S8_9BILA
MEILVSDRILSKLSLEKNSSKVANQMKAEESFPFLLRNLDVEDRRKIEYVLKEIIIECMIGDEKCDLHSDFEVFEDITYGLCYTFNGKSPSKFNVSKSGPSQGLKMLLYTNMTEYTNFTQSSGVRVIIHDQDIFSFPGSYGYFAPIHQYTSFSFKKTVTERINYARRKCVSEPDPKTYLYPGGFTIEGCQRSCFQQKAIELCGCADPRFPLFGQNQTYCLVEDIIKRECLSNNMVSMDDEMCNCQNPCHEVTFTTTISSANLKLPLVLNHYEKVNISIADYIYTEIFYDTIHIEILQEEPANTFYNLISEIGAVIGFWLGMSVIGFLEGVIFLIEFSVGLLYYVDDYMYQKRAPPLPEVELPKIAFYDPGIIPVKRDWDVHAQAYKSEIEKGLIELRHKNAKQYHLIMGNFRYLRNSKKHYKCKICKVKVRPNTAKRILARQEALFIRVKERNRDKLI